MDLIKCRFTDDEINSLIRRLWNNEFGITGFDLTAKMGNWLAKDIQEVVGVLIQMIQEKGYPNPLDSSNHQTIGEANNKDKLSI